MFVRGILDPRWRDAEVHDLFADAETGPRLVARSGRRDRQGREDLGDKVRVIQRREVLLTFEALLQGKIFFSFSYALAQLFTYPLDLAIGAFATHDLPDDLLGAELMEDSDIMCPEQDIVDSQEQSRQNKEGVRHDPLKWR